MRFYCTTSKHLDNDRKEKGLVAEKATSIYQKGGYTEKDVECNIFSNPFKRFADIRFLKRSKDVSLIEINKNIFNKLTDKEKNEILKICDMNLNEYYIRIEN